MGRFPIYKCGNDYLDLVCYELNDVFTAEFAENAEIVMPLRIWPLRALRSRALRAVNSYLNNDDFIGNYQQKFLFF
jgi:hypothetical protein